MSFVLFILCLFFNLFKVNSIDYDNIAERHPIVQSDINRLLDLNIASYFAPDDVEVMKTRRVRREIRDIPYEQYMKVADAMNIMKQTSQEEGQRIYGSKFQNYDHMVCFHGQSAWSKLGDESHVGPQFPPWHRAFLLMFEESILAIDPSIEAVPYWDLRRDVDDPLHSIVWTEKFFGELMGDAEYGYAIKDGPFKHWEVGNAFDSGCGDQVHNIWGQLRSRISPNKNKYVTRIGGAMCNYTNFIIGTIEEWEECLNVTEYDNYASYDDCYESTVHSDAHIFVGGSKPIDAPVIVMNESWPGGTGDCFSWLNTAEMTQTNHTINRYYAHNDNGCFECPEHCDLDDESLACRSCKVVRSGENCTLIGDDGTVYETDLDDEWIEYLWGDFLDTLTSPNDPFFWFHHINLDRYNFIWQLYNFENSKDYYLYPAYGYEYGCNLDDIAGGGERPFVNLFDYMGEEYKDKHLTIRDIFDATTFELAPYTYDDIMVALKQGVAGGENPTDKEAVEEYDGSMNNIFGNFDKLGLISIILTVCVIFFLGVWYLIYNCNLNSSNFSIKNHSNNDKSGMDKLNNDDSFDMGIGAIAMASRSIDSLQDGNIKFDNYGSV